MAHEGNVDARAPLPQRPAAWEATREWLRKWKASSKRLGLMQEGQRAGGSLEDAGQCWKTKKRTQKIKRAALRI